VSQIRFQVNFRRLTSNLDSEQTKRNLEKRLKTHFINRVNYLILKGFTQKLNRLGEILSGRRQTRFVVMPAHRKQFCRSIFGRSVMNLFKRLKTHLRNMPIYLILRGFVKRLNHLGDMMHFLGRVLSRISILQIL
jgi:hypothetical protein